MSDFMDRPTHPDFGLLSEIVVGNDNRSRHPEFDYRTYLATIIDPDSATYMATGRAKLMLAALGPLVSKRELARTASVYLDGFVHGAEFARRKAEAEGEQP
jgi:hypothetical protein